MQIIWEQELVAKLKDHHTVLELDTFDVNGKQIVTYCIVPAEKLLADIANLSAYINLHENFIKAYKEKDFKLCADISEHLIGKFAGELDTFYAEILSRNKQ